MEIDSFAPLGGGNALSFAATWHTCTTCGDSFALCPTDAISKTKLSAKRRYNYQVLQRFCVSQLDKLTCDIHRRVIHGVDADFKCLVLHCDFSQDLAHAMADQSLCEYFDIIASSLFICAVHFWDPVTN